MGKRLDVIKKRFVSLKMRFVAIFLLAAVLSVFLYFTASMTMTNFINNVYLSEENKAKREREYHSDLQSYISDNGITFESIDRVSEWAKQNQYVYLLIYKEQTDDEAYFIPDDMADKYPTRPPQGAFPDSGDQSPGEGGESIGGENGADSGSGGSSSDKDDEYDQPIGGITVTWPTRSDLEEEAKKRDMLVIELPENQFVYAKFAEYTEYLYYDIANLTSLGLAALLVLIIFLIYITRLTHRISRLGTDVNTVAAGDTEKHIFVGGKDEISELAANVETMRASIVENYKKEKEALDSNTALITSMSHDIRTPLTVLLGYIDVMKSYTDGDEQMQGYLKAAEKTAMRLKELSDDMFGYFLVFGRDERELEFECYDAQMLLEQMLAEHVLLLRENGYSVSVDIDSAQIGEKQVRIDAQSMIRMFDNIFSNIYKYADKENDISVRLTLVEQSVLVAITNKIRVDGERVESNGIGLKTCAKLAEHMNSEFTYSSDGKLFTASLKMPCVNTDGK